MRLPLNDQALPDIEAFLARTWEALASDDFAFCVQAIDAVTSALPPDDGSYNSSEVIVAENCLLSLVYALRCKASGDKKDAHWALMKAYDAADQIALIQWRAQRSENYTEADIRAMPVLQRELANQAAAFEAIIGVSDIQALALVHTISFSVEFATEGEWKTLSG